MKKCGRTSRLVEFTRVTVNTAGHELGLIYFDSARLPWPNFTSRIFYALKDPLSCWLDVLDVAITISTSSVRFKFPNNFKVKCSPIAVKVSGRRSDVLSHQSQILGVSSTAVVSKANVTSQHSIRLTLFDPFPNATTQPPGVYREGCTIRELAHSSARPYPANLSGSGRDTNRAPSSIRLRIVREKLLQRVSAALNINESPLGEEARTREDDPINGGIMDASGDVIHRDGYLSICQAMHLPKSSFGCVHVVEIVEMEDEELYVPDDVPEEASAARHSPVERIDVELYRSKSPAEFVQALAFCLPCQWYDRELVDDAVIYHGNETVFEIGSQLHRNVNTVAIVIQPFGPSPMPQLNTSSYLTSVVINERVHPAPNVLSLPAAISQKYHILFITVTGSYKISHCDRKPNGLSRDDGKRPDGMTLVPWNKGQPLVWDVTVVDTLADSYVLKTSEVSGFAAEMACKRKHNKYRSIISSNYIFKGLAFETLGPWCKETIDFINVIGDRLIAESGDSKSKKFVETLQAFGALFQTPHYYRKFSHWREGGDFGPRRNYKYEAGRADGL
ncbi:hypothetical protein GEV33_011563 [Tenebrio molitor]|uniref:Uncharacterized protein n=1 Tax=Tenebrio molitor TaxID=7067 RepID=A0A8J6HB14_TENMO|nr:hypothetical protein GEV33_011563 [Tenebrio molitor]